MFIDTAAVYRNEAEIGRALADSGLERSQVFIVSKLGPKQQGFFFFFLIWEERKGEEGFGEVFGRFGLGFCVKSDFFRV